ncbi:MAG: GatB/YqeY domain-containing protein [Gammaproteobacteria bacterium]
MSDALKPRIQDDVKTAMRARDRARLGVLRMVSAAIKQQEIDGQSALDDTGVIGVLQKMIRQRRDAEGQFRAAGRQDLADQEAFEIRLIEGYMPQPLSQAEVEVLVEDLLNEVGASSMKDMGKVMALLKPRLQGRADLGAVSALVKGQLSRPR